MVQDTVTEATVQRTCVQVLSSYLRCSGGVRPVINASHHLNELGVGQSRTDHDVDALQRGKNILITFKSGRAMVRRRERGKRVIKCKVIRGEACVKLHRILVRDIKCVKIRELKRRNNGKIKVWKMEGEKARRKT